MSFKFKKKLPVPKEIKELYPVSPALAEKKKLLDTEIIDVITGKSDKFLAIIGPCSADNEESVCEYIERLVKVQEKIKDKVIIIPRIYTNKPRTTGEGYKGMLHQPDPEKAPDLLQGIIAIRKLHMHALETYGMPIAEEMLTKLGYDKNVIERVSYLVGHHHTYSNIDGIDYQILVEADFLVNIDEDEMTKETAENVREKIFKTKSGTQMLDNLFLTELIK